MVGRRVLGPLSALVVGAMLGTGAYLLVDSTGSDSHAAAMPGARVLSAVERREVIQELSDDEMDARVEPAVLLADVRACGKIRQATVTIVGTPDGPVGLTNAHVTRGASTVTLSGAGLGVSDVRVLRYLADRDAAEVDVGPLDAPLDSPLPLGPDAESGDEVTTVGFPEGRWTIQSGHVIAVQQRAGWGGAGDVLMIDVPAHDGTSGGVVVDSAGEAVGLIAARDPRTGYTIAYPIRDLLTRPGTSDVSC